MIDRALALSGKRFVPEDYQGDSVSLRAIADHARAATFLIADGVFPEKTGREYVLRRIMRRAVYHGWLIGIKEPFLAKVAEDVIAKMGSIYPDVKERASLIGKTIFEEETRFRETLDRGVGILDDKMRGASGKVVAGAVAFQLYDTFGFPIDLTRVIAEQRGWTVDEKGFDVAMAEQRKRSEFHGSGEVAVDDVFKKIAERVGRHAVPRLRRRRYARLVEDHRAARRRAKRSPRSAPTRSGSRSSPPRRRSTASRAARSATPA